MGKKSGQAALEFLMNYGWVLLVILASVGALSFSGVLNPARYMKQSCLLGPGFICEDFKVVKGAIPANDKIFIRVTNNRGQALDTFTIHVAKDSPSSSEFCGGFLGAVTHPDFVSNPAFPVFLDGETRDLKNADTLAYLTGISCNTGSMSLVCCSVLDKPDSSEKMCDSSTKCDVPLPPKKSKFDEALVITYRESGSTILQQRIGKITTQVE